MAAVAGCATGQKLPEMATYGPNPTLVDPAHSLIPTVKIAKVVGWPAGGAPTPAPGLKVAAFARGLDHPRWMLVLPNGDVLVAETNGPGYEKPTGIRGFFEKLLVKNAGAGEKSPNRILLLRDGDGDGVAETKTVLVGEGLNSPFGMALVGGRLYVANTDSIVSWPFQPGQTQVTGPATKLADLPGGPIDHHWTKNIIPSADGTKLYATVGSNSNVGDHGPAAEENRADILVVDIATGHWSVLASGIRNPNGMDLEPVTGALWTVVNERDELGDNLVPDYMTSVKPGAFYGWPYSYWGQHVDKRPKPPRPDLVARAIAPDYALGAHTASLGLVFDRGPLLPARYRGGAFVGQHGSWNRSEPAGYRVIFVPFQAGRPSGLPQPVLTGFLNAKGEAQGRPVGVVEDKAGALLVADDVGGVIWRVTPAG
ncbi:MAG TPA: sorbosone dehydrogenase family protein [Caulobacteraceae bacterium]|nr:sorbosone dehydrogenase family protein [Caulobacteraceae bacterium]